MRRRAFISLLGGAAAWPLTARAQQPERMRRIGLLMGVADDREGQARVTALKQGLQELGWTDGGNIQIETRFAGADVGRIRSHAAELSTHARRNCRPNNASHPGAAAGDKLHSDRNRGSQRSRRARLRFAASKFACDGAEASRPSSPIWVARIAEALGSSDR
jgi:uncharacterized protein YfiM (DUF2279 family)